jgi:hypothetical protein
MNCRLDSEREMVRCRGTQMYIQYILFIDSSSVYGSWNNPADVAMGYGLDGRGLVPGRGKRFFSAPQHPDQP